MYETQMLYKLEYIFINKIINTFNYIISNREIIGITNSNYSCYLQPINKLINSLEFNLNFIVFMCVYLLNSLFHEHIQ